jgi:hypothetical protein
MILWSPAANDTCIVGFEDVTELNKIHPEFSSHSKVYKNYEVFKSKELMNFQLVPTFPGARNAAPLPADISILLKRPKKDVPYVGAYPL